MHPPACHVPLQEHPVDVLGEMAGVEVHDRGVEVGEGKPLGLGTVVGGHLFGKLVARDLRVAAQVFVSPASWDSAR